MSTATTSNRAPSTHGRVDRKPHDRRARERVQAALLIATAADSESRGALHVAAAIAERDKLPVVALGVAAPFPQNVSTLVSLGQPVTIDETARRELLDEVSRFVAHIPGSEHWVKRALLGTPEEEIVDAAARWKAQLIVLGLGRHGRLDRLFERETAIAVMRHARVPVLAVVPRARGLPNRALAAIDFTPASTAAATLAARLLAPGGTLVAAHVSAFSDAGMKPGGIADVYRTGARAKLEAVADELRRATTCAVESVLLDGNPGDALVRFARRTHCDLVALGGHEQGLVDRILLGSVRTRVVRAAPCSLLVAPPAAR
ncbi:MAG TPA: universal stress protein [Gemmatimonadaceae bacterium]|nr:universal stress protein [Gemmatimonadaceae bacterium]